MSEPMSDVSLSSSSPSHAHEDETDAIDEEGEEEEEAAAARRRASNSPLQKHGSLLNQQQPSEKEELSSKAEEDEDMDSDHGFEHKNGFDSGLGRGEREATEAPMDDDNDNPSQDYDPAEPLALEDLMMDKEEDAEGDHGLDKEDPEADQDVGDVEEEVEEETGDDFDSLDFLKHPSEEDDGTPEEQDTFVRELERFFAERKMEYRHPKFYGENLNCLKLWRAVVRLGGYDAVTAGKLWRQVGDTFKPPKSCTTVSWSFRGFYEKALLDYERYKLHGIVPSSSQVSSQPDAGEDLSNAQANNSQQISSGRARRDAASRAMQGWHSQRYFGNGDTGDTTSKQEKGHNSSGKRAKQLKMSLLKKKKTTTERTAHVSHTKGLRTPNADYNTQLKEEHGEETDDPSLFSTQKKKPLKHDQGSHAWKNNNMNSSNRDDIWVADEGPEADWVKINVHKARDCFEVYALIPGLLRDEVRIQCEPGGQVVIVGEPERPNNPWGITSFKKVINLPLPIDASQTSAVVTLHGQLFVKIPYGQTRS